MMRPAGAAAATNSTSKENQMNIETFKAEHPDLFEAIVNEAQAGMAAAVEQARTDGAAGERQRIADVRAQLIPGHEALIEGLAFDGKSSAADAALAIVNAEKGLRTTAAAALDAEAPPVVPAVQEEEAGKTIKRADFNKLPPHEQAATATSGVRIVD